MSAVDLSAASTVLRKGAPNRIPALLIGRLAVDERLAGMGLGTELVKHALASAVELNTRAACRAVVVTALHEASRRFWQRFGFEPLDPDQPSGLDLYLMTSDIAETLERL